MTLPEGHVTEPILRSTLLLTTQKWISLIFLKTIGDPFEGFPIFGQILNLKLFLLFLAGML